MDESDHCVATDEPRHRPRLISRAAVGQVMQCGCGHLHLNLQVLTLRFERAAFRELTALLTFAQRKLDADARLCTNDDAAPLDGCGPVH